MNLNRALLIGQLGQNLPWPLVWVQPCFFDSVKALEFGLEASNVGAMGVLGNLDKVAMAVQNCIGPTIFVVSTLPVGDSSVSCLVMGVDVVVGVNQLLVAPTILEEPGLIHG